MGIACEVMLNVRGQTQSRNSRADKRHARMLQRPQGLNVVQCQSLVCLLQALLWNPGRSGSWAGVGRGPLSSVCRPAGGCWASLVGLRSGHRFGTGTSCSCPAWHVLAQIPSTLPSPALTPRPGNLGRVPCPPGVPGRRPPAKQYVAARSCRGRVVHRVGK